MEYKNILIILREDNEELSDWIKDKVVDKKHDFVFWDPKKISELEGNLLISDLVINFLENDDKDFEIIQKRIEELKIDFFGNTLLSNKIFRQKKTFKEILRKLDLKTPIFEKIDGRDSQELFLNFPQPSRIFSKENKFFSNKLTKMMEDIQDVLNNIKKKDDYFIEEFIEGNDIYVFIYKNIFKDFSVIGIEKKGDEYFSLDTDIKNEINNIISNKIKFEYKDFALIHLLNNDKRGLYFLHNFISNYDIFDKKEILKKIFALNHIEFPKKLFEKDLF